MKRFYVITFVICVLLLFLYACGLSIEQTKSGGTQAASNLSNQHYR